MLHNSTVYSAFPNISTAELRLVGKNPTYKFGQSETDRYQLGPDIFRKRPWIYDSELGDILPCRHEMSLRKNWSFMLFNAQKVQSHNLNPSLPEMSEFNNVTQIRSERKWIKFYIGSTRSVPERTAPIPKSKLLNF